MKKLLLLFFIIVTQLSFSQKEETSQSKLEIRISRLEKENDSLHKSISDILENDYKSVEVIDSVTNYYENAWNKLIYLLAVIGGIMVVILPIFLSRQQKNELKGNKLDFQEDVDKKINELEEKILTFNRQEAAELRSEINKSSDEILRKQEQEIERLYAMSFFLQGIHAITLKDTDLIIDSFKTSIQSLLKLKTKTNLRQCLDHLNKAVALKVKENSNFERKKIDELRKIVLDIKTLFPDEFNNLLEILSENLNSLE